MGKGVMLWSKLYFDVPDHPKTLLLNALLNENNSHVYPLNIWCWATKHAPDGVISGAAGKLDTLVEQAARWRGEKGLLFKSLLEAGWLDALQRRPTTRVMIHNWPAINGAHARKAAKDAERQARKREKERLISLTAGRREQNRGENSANIHFSLPNSEVPEIRPEDEDVRVTSRVTSTGCPPVENHKPPMRAEPGIAQKKLVVVAGKKKKKTSKSFLTTTTKTTNRLGLRNEDLARDLFGELVAGLEAGKRFYVAEQLRARTYPLRIEDEVLELGTADDFALGWFHEHAELLALDALRAIDESMKIRVVIAQKPEAQAPPEKWILEECVLWLGREGLATTPSPTEANLINFWHQAVDIRPAALIAAARSFRADPYWAKDNWALYKFICDGVWKIRLPKLQSVAPASGYR